MIKTPKSIVFYSWTELATRALTLADSGKYDSWEAVAAVIEEDHPGATIRLRAAKRLCADISARCANAQQDFSTAV